MLSGYFEGAVVSDAMVTTAMRTSVLRTSVHVWVHEIRAGLGPGLFRTIGRKVESNATIVVITTVACKKTGRAQTRLELLRMCVWIRDRDWPGQTNTGASQRSVAVIWRTERGNGLCELRVELVKVPNQLSEHNAIGGIII